MPHIRFSRLIFLAAVTRLDQRAETGAQEETERALRYGGGASEGKWFLLCPNVSKEKGRSEGQRIPKVGAITVYNASRRADVGVSDGIK
jgi:hypothetical protein